MLTKSEFLARQAAIADEMGLTDEVTEPAVLQEVQTVERFTLPDIAFPVLADDTVHVDTMRTWSPSDTATTEWGPKDIGSGGTLAVFGYDDDRPVDNYPIHDIQVDACSLVWKSKNCTNLTFERINIDLVKPHTEHRGICKLTGLTGHTVIKNVKAIGDLTEVKTSTPQAFICFWGKARFDADGNPTGMDENLVNITQAGGTVEIDGFHFENMLAVADYANTDGISMERTWSGTIRNGLVRNVSDACLDLKGDVAVDRVTVDGGRNGLKAWSDQTHGSMIFGEFRHAAIMIPQGNTITFEGDVWFDGSCPVLGGNRACHLIFTGSVQSEAAKWFAPDCAAGSTITLPDGTVLTN